MKDNIDLGKSSEAVDPPFRGSILGIVSQDTFEYRVGFNDVLSPSLMRWYEGERADIWIRDCDEFNPDIKNIVMVRTGDRIRDMEYRVGVIEGEKYAARVGESLEEYEGEIERIFRQNAVSSTQLIDFMRENSVAGWPATAGKQGL